MKNKGKVRNTYLMYLFGAIAVICVVMLFINRNFFSVMNLISMLEQMADYALMALGIMLCICAAGIDLSTVGVANMVAAISAVTLLKVLPEESSQPKVILWTVLIVLISVAVGAASGILNGVLITKLGIPPMLATMSASYLYTGICMVLTRGVSVSGINTGFVNIFTSKLFGVFPIAMVIFIVCAFLIFLLLRKTTYGVNLCMVGTNQTATRLAGIRNDRIIIAAHTISSTLSAVAGIIMLARLSSSRADYGKSYTTQAILIAILGGTSPLGGTFSVAGTVIGIFIVQAITTAVSMTPGANSYLKNLVYAVLLLAVMIMDYYRTNRKPKRKTK